jgi:hypothetical protein
MLACAWAMWVAVTTTPVMVPVYSTSAHAMLYSSGQVTR